MDDNITFEFKTENSDLVTIFSQWKEESTTYHDELLRHQKISEQYYIGNQTDKEFVAPYNSDTVENRVFESVETMTPIATANAHQFVAVPGNDNEVSMKKAENVQKVLGTKYDDLGIQEKLETITRKIMLYRFGVLKWVWSEVHDDVDVLEIDPRLILIPKVKIDPNRPEFPYVIEKQEYAYDEMEEYFPKAKLDELSEYGETGTGKSSTDYPKLRRTYVVYEVTTNEMKAWFSSGKILDKRENPYWDFKGNDVKTRDPLPGGARYKVRTKKVFRNHLDRPTKEYVFFTTFRVADEPIGSVSLAEIGIPIQDAINVQKRRIIDNLRSMGNGQIIMDSDTMSEEEAGNITDEPGLTIRGEGAASQGKVKREPGVPLPNGHFENLSHSEQVFDNLMGTHSATRGVANSKTLGQDILSRQQDFSRIDLITRVLNRGMGLVANGLVQLMKMYYTEIHVIPVLGVDSSIEFIRMLGSDIEDNTVVKVKTGQTLQMDEVSTHNEAIQLWQLQAIDPVTLFERLKFPNPEKSAERLLMWKQGQLDQETQAKIALAQAGAQAGAQAKAQELSAKGVQAGQGRGVEMPMNVIQRATMAMGGTAPVAPGTPNQ